VLPAPRERKCLTTFFHLEAKLTELENPTKYRPIDLLEAECHKLKEVDSPLIHRFTPGLYIREIYLYAGSIAVTKIHNTEHPYVISKGKVSVSTDGENWEHVEAPFTGITKPGPQRIIIVYEDTIWITFHPNPDNETDLLKIEERIIKKHEIPPELLSDIPALNLPPDEEPLKL
jgi:hypothetical protein